MLEYATALFDAATIERIRAATSSAARRRWWRTTGATIAELPLLSADERRRIAGRLERDGSARTRRDACVHELFEAQARRTPDAVAVVVRGRAAHLRRARTRARTGWRSTCARWASAPTCASACASSASLEMVVALLAVLKAGGAYVPLDPALSARAARVHARGQRARARADARPHRRGACSELLRGARCGARRRRRCRALGARAGERSATRRAERAQPGLRDLHLRLDGPAQGRR